MDTSRPNSCSNNFPTGLNLNLPPESTVRNEFGIIDVNALPFDGVCSEPNLPTTNSELVKPLSSTANTNAGRAAEWQKRKTTAYYKMGKIKSP